MDKRIGFGPRLGAALIDFLIVCAAIVVIGPLLGGLLGAAALSEASKEAGDPAAQGAIYGGLHFVLGTLGAFTFDALSRLGGLLGVVAFFGCFLALGEKKQALHDLIAGTAVYPKAALEPAPQPAA